jgi:hypothetical protein
LLYLNFISFRVAPPGKMTAPELNSQQRKFSAAGLWHGWKFALLQKSSIVHQEGAMSEGGFAW